ncbi:hypothetical protein NHN18_01070 [Riemerella anatipestifer]|uniref:hypothetical protein n=1 Tax=Riemerella anatipestifer TaxID=34085 RepID=UPI002097869E|nr:hypothetical protein [Riemerella anatipestifer]MCO7352078.1 hypothetical protein [Riemerella anatipestifer]MCT6766306.1 hypothetical protein [Riemerella anatipestifer]
MKFKKLTALLCLSQITLHAGFLGNKKSFAKLDEDQLQTIEEALEEKDTSDLEQQLSDSQATIKNVENALEQALNIAGVEAGADMIASIVALGEKCKEYGESTNRHTFAKNTGVDEEADSLIEGYLDPNDEHNQLLKQITHGK